MARKVLTDPKTERDQRFFRIGYAEACSDILEKIRDEGVEGAIAWIANNGGMADEYFKA